MISNSSAIRCSWLQRFQFEHLCRNQFQFLNRKSYLTISVHPPPPNCALLLPLFTKPIFSYHAILCYRLVSCNHMETTLDSRHERSEPIDLQYQPRSSAAYKPSLTPSPNPSPEIPARWQRNEAQSSFQPPDDQASSTSDAQSPNSREHPWSHLMLPSRRS